MLRVFRLSLLAAGAVVLTFPLFAACGGDDGVEGVDLETWTRGLCDSVTSWVDDVQAASAFEVPDESTPEGIKEIMVEFLTGVEERTREFQSDVSGLGVPDTGDGKEIQAAVSAAAGTVVELYGVALADAEALDAGDEDVLTTQLPELSRAIASAGEGIGEAFAQINEDYDTTEISAAADDIPECEGMFAT